MPSSSPESPPDHSPSTASPVVTTEPESVSPTVATSVLTGPLRQLFVGVAVSALGSGLVAPYLYVYLTQARHLPSPTVGLVIAWMGIVSLCVAPFGGTAIDRFGPRACLVTALAVEVLGVVALSRADAVPSAVIAVSLVCIGQVVLHPSISSLLARLARPEARERVFGYQFMLLNAGMGIGGIVGSLLIDTQVPATFERLYLLNAATFAVNLLVVATLPKGTGLVAPEDRHEHDGRWGDVLSDRTFLRYILVAALMLTFGYAQIETGLPAYAVDVAHISPNVLGWVWAANTGAIVLVQLVAIRFISGRRRSRMLALTAATWSLSWLIVATSAVVPPSVAAACVIGGMAVFGVGETLLAPVAPALVNHLAPEHLRGRYNAFSGLTWTVATIVGPALGGLLVGTGHAPWWVVLTVGGSAVAALLYLGLGRVLTPDQDGVGSFDAGDSDGEDSDRGTPAARAAST